MASYDPRMYPVHSAIHPAMMGNMGARFAPPHHHGASQGHAPSPHSSSNVSQRQGSGSASQGGETSKKKAGIGWENTYRTAQRIAFPDPQSACGERVGEFVDDIAKGIGCPVEYVISPLLPCVGGLLGTTTNVHVHRGWCEPPIVWSLVGASSGSRRSAVIRQLLNPILSVQKQRMSKVKNRTKDTKQENGNIVLEERALYSGTRITLAALTEVLHRNEGHAFSLTENVENLHEMLGLLQPIPAPRLVSVLEDLYEGLPLVAVEDGHVTTILGSNFCHGGFANPEYMVTLMLKCPAWFSSRVLMSCPQTDDMKGVFGEPNSDLNLPDLEQVYSVILDKHKEKVRYTFDSEAIQELSRFFDEEWSTVLNQLEQNEHEGIIGKSMGQIVRISGILKALDNALQYCGSESDDDYEWDWIIDPATIRCAIVLGKYFLEQKLAMTFMVETGFFNYSGNSTDKDNGSMNGNLDMEYPDSPTTLPQTAFQENHRTSGPSFQGGGNDGGQTDNSGSSSTSSVAGNSHFPTANFPMSQSSNFQSPMASMKPDSAMNQPPSMSSFLPTPSPTQTPGHRFDFPKKNRPASDVDYSTLPHMMTTMEEDMSEMMQAIDFVHFSKTQFVAVHGRRIKRLLECYDDGHGVSATTAAQKSITPPVRIEGTNNRHPAWASALFFQKVADLGLGIAEQGRHPTNRKVCWRFKRKPIAQLTEKDYQLLQYLRIEMEKYSQFGSAPFNPTLMINSGVISLAPSSNNQPSSSSSPLPQGVEDESSNSQGSPRNPMSISVKPEIF